MPLGYGPGRYLTFWTGEVPDGFLLTHFHCAGLRGNYLQIGGKISGGWEGCGFLPADPGCHQPLRNRNNVLTIYRHPSFVGELALLSPPAGPPAAELSQVSKARPGAPGTRARSRKGGIWGSRGTRISSTVCHLLLMEYKNSAADQISASFASVGADITRLLPLQLHLYPV